MERCAVYHQEQSEISFQVWPPRLNAKGAAGIRAVAGPLRLLLYCTAVSKLLGRVVWLVLVAFVLLS